MTKSQCPNTSMTSSWCVFGFEASLKRLREDGLGTIADFLFVFSSPCPLLAMPTYWDRHFVAHISVCCCASNSPSCCTPNLFLTLTAKLFPDHRCTMSVDYSIAPEYRVSKRGILSSKSSLRPPALLSIMPLISSLASYGSTSNRRISEVAQLADLQQMKLSVYVLYSFPHLGGR